MRLQLLKKNLPAFVALTLSCSGIIPANASSFAGTNDVNVVNKVAAADNVVECATIKDALDQEDGTVVSLTLDHAYVLFQKTIPTSNGREVLFLLSDNSGVITVSNIALDGNNLKLQGKELNGTLEAKIKFEGNVHKLVKSANTYPVNLEVKDGTAPEPAVKNLSELSDADIAKLVTVSGTLTTEGDLFEAKYYLQKGTDKVQLVDKMQMVSDWDSAVGAELSFTGIVLDGVSNSLELMPLEAPSVQYVYSEKGDKDIQPTSDNVKVTIERTFKGGVWNTFCAPFDLTIGQVVDVFGNGTELKVFSKDHKGSVIYFNDTTSVKAGTPCIIVPVKDKVDPVFNNVKVTEAAPQTASTDDGEYKFTGIYKPKALKVDKTELFLSNNNFYYPASEDVATINGFRAFFTVPQGIDSNVLKVSVDGQTTSVSKLVAGEVKENAPIYNLNGQLVGNDAARLAKGLYIKNGKKFIVK